MKVAVPRETRTGERRVALVPKDVAALCKKGAEVAVEAGAGESALCEDSSYAGSGASVSTRRQALADADLVLTVNGISVEEAPNLNTSATVVGFLGPMDNPSQMQALAVEGLSLLAVELIPRITRAQAMDTLSSMAMIAGYKAVILAAQHAPSLFPLMMTAAGTLTPARVFVIGAGVAGLQAIATARRLGALVEGYDIRPEVKEQVESLGASFVELDIGMERVTGTGGYAAEQSKEYYRRQQEALGEHLSRVDVIITTAAVPGRRAPMLLPTEITDRLRPGTVVVDLAAERGGNCSLTVPGEVVVTNGVTVDGPVNLPSSVPAHASQMYSKNMLNLVSLLLKDGGFQLDTEDEIVRGALVAHGGRIVHPAVKDAIAKRAAPA
ncbi:MAG: Re/Si-specific NAD(P)(+) transhydrogenase subunit alpha [Bryobacterales bacterium]|nr:Re/Si-specific NAD(P)(+) transhydrogenase subunit alpha [Bryobacterales bacterium]MDE0625678.1 Re/Si-specific NAD(P)(+) transhydrogenase subunit alpha [Bryobacterales bacterium]